MGERLIVFTDNTDADGAAACFAATKYAKGEPPLVIVAGRPVAIADNEGKYSANLDYFDQSLSNAEHAHNAARMANDIPGASVHIGLPFGPWEDTEGSYDYTAPNGRAVTVAKYNTGTTIPHKYHYPPMVHALVPGPNGLVEPKSFESALDTIFGPEDDTWHVSLSGPAGELAVALRIAKELGLAHRIGRIVAQGDFFGLDIETNLAFGQPFNRFSAKKDADYLVKEHEGPVTIIPSMVSRRPDVSFTSEIVFDPAQDTAPPAMNDVRSRLGLLFGPNPPEALVRGYETHHVEAWKGLAERAIDTEKPARPLTMSADDVHTIYCIMQGDNSQSSGGLYTWEPFDIPGAKGDRFVVTDVDAEAFLRRCHTDFSNNHRP